MTHELRPAVRATLVVCFASFVFLGLPEGILGTAWPEIRSSFEAPVERLAWLSASYASGYLVSSLVSGRFVGSFGLRRAASVMALAAAGGVLLIGSAFDMSLVLVGSALLGFGVGGIDSSLNAYMTLRHGPREMHALHGFFGVGAALGPLIARGAFSVDLSWRVLYLALGLLWLGTAVRFSTDEELDVAHTDQTNGAGDQEPTHARLATVLLLSYFAFYVSAEVIMGQWSFSLLTEERGVSGNLAGVATAGFWGGLTIGRFALSVLGNRAQPFQTLRGSILLIAASVAVFWLDPRPGLDLLAMAMTGLGMAGVFPSLVTVTPSLVGRARTANLVGYQLAASSAGFIIAPLTLAAIVGAKDLEAMPPFVLMLIGGLACTHVGLERLNARSRQPS